MTEDDQVRRLLAAARHTDPTPADVVERLDGVLADLHAGRPPRPAVTDLAAARRRRRARALLVAAAAVVVAGVGFNQLLGASTSGGDASSSADSGGAAEVQGSQGDGLASGLPGDRFEGAPGTASKPAARVAATDFGESALRLRRVTLTTQLDGAYSLAKARCTGRDAGTGTLVPIRYDGRPAALVYRLPRGRTQVVDLYLCGRGGVARSITLPAP
ncbi:hypothetical protein GCM10027062_12580 [Nocardioides hungaricus]